METAQERVLRLVKKYPGVKPLKLLDKAITHKRYPSREVRHALANLLFESKLELSSDRRLRITT